MIQKQKPFLSIEETTSQKNSFPHKGNFPHSRNNKRGEHKSIRIRAERKEMEINGMKQTTNDETEVNYSDFFFANIQGKTGKYLFLVDAGPLLK